MHVIEVNRNFSRFCVACYSIVQTYWKILSMELWGLMSIVFYFIFPWLKQFSTRWFAAASFTGKIYSNGYCVTDLRKSSHSTMADNFFMLYWFHFVPATYKRFIPGMLSVFIYLGNKDFLPSGYQLICIVRWREKKMDQTKRKAMNAGTASVGYYRML